LKLPHKRTVIRALDLWNAGPRLDFNDALLLAHAGRLGSAGILRYDWDFDSIPGIIRTEPTP
jgi:predicted nucleic acid-binding protein